MDGRQEDVLTDGCASLCRGRLCEVARGARREFRCGTFGTSSASGNLRRLTLDRLGGDGGCLRVLVSSLVKLDLRLRSFRRWAGGGLLCGARRLRLRMLLSAVLD